MAPAPPNPNEHKRDVIAIGASMGGLEALSRLLGALPAEMAAAFFVVLHTADHNPGLLADVLGKASRLPVGTATEGERFERGRVYVAPPDRHLIVGHDHVHVRRGPRENGTRPAIDPLFRSAAANCTTRVTGVLLTGLLNDGTSGLQAIKQCGGLVVIQEPRDATYAEMPRSALRHVVADHVVTLDEMATVLAAIALEPRPPAGEVPDHVRAEALIAAQEFRDMDDPSRTGTLAPVTCPECHGALQEIRDGDLIRFRCHTGHAFTCETLVAIHAEAWERALYCAFRAQHERAMLVRRMAENADREGAAGTARHLRRRADGYDEGAELLRRLIAHGSGATEAK